MGAIFATTIILVLEVIRVVIVSFTLQLKKTIPGVSKLQSPRSPVHSPLRPIGLEKTSLKVLVIKYVRHTHYTLHYIQSCAISIRHLSA